jgi:hypothetical protein
MTFTRWGQLAPTSAAMRDVRVRPIAAVPRTVIQGAIVGLVEPFGDRAFAIPGVRPCDADHVGLDGRLLPTVCASTL